MRLPWDAKTRTVVARAHSPMTPKQHEDILSDRVVVSSESTTVLTEIRRRPCNRSIDQYGLFFRHLIIIALG